MLTEQRNPKSENLEQLPTLDILRLMNEEDKRLPALIAEVLPAIERAVEVIVAAFQQNGRLIYVGAGTSGRLGALDASECPPTFNVSLEMVRALIAGGEQAFVQAVEGAEDDLQAGQQDLFNIQLLAKDVVVGIAASGRTPYVLGAIEGAKQIGSATIGIACNVPSPLLHSVDIPIGVQVGPEIITGSTRLKSGTVTKMILNMLSTASMIRMGKVYGNFMVDVRPTNAKLVARAQRMIREITGADEATAARLLHDSGNNVKVAVVMHKRQVSRTEAQALLEQAKGFLRAVID
jgi:N-acetylmuramic acid 6-phosphate etherase